jgi:hypothetical protein
VDLGEEGVASKKGRGRGSQRRRRGRRRQWRCCASTSRHSGGRRRERIGRCCSARWMARAVAMVCGRTRHSSCPPLPHLPSILPSTAAAPLSSVELDEEGGGASTGERGRRWGRRRRGW